MDALNALFRNFSSHLYSFIKRTLCLTRDLLVPWSWLYYTIDDLLNEVDRSKQREMMEIYVDTMLSNLKITGLSVCQPSEM
jgi:hypothetical protein